MMTASIGLRPRRLARPPHGSAFGADFSKNLPLGALHRAPAGGDDEIGDLAIERVAHLHARGLVVYLYATVDQLLARTAKDRARPLLQTASPRARCEELMQVRDPLYREIADLVVDTGRRTVKSAEREILAKIRTEG